LGAGENPETKPWKREISRLLQAARMVHIESGILPFRGSTRESSMDYSQQQLEGLRETDRDIAHLSGENWGGKESVPYNLRVCLDGGFGVKSEPQRLQNATGWLDRSFFLKFSNCTMKPCSIRAVVKGPEKQVSRASSRRQS